MKTCDIIIPVWNQPFFTKVCIESVLDDDDSADCDIIVIDNASDKPTADYLKKIGNNFSNVKVIRNENNLGFIKAVNKGFAASKASYVCLLNNDTIVTKGWLKRLIELAERNPAFGLINPLGGNEHIKNNMSLEEYARSIKKNKGRYTETAQAMGFCMLIKREVIEKIGFLDEIFGMGGFDDTDFSKRAFLAGYKCITSLDTYVHHRENISFKVLGNVNERVKRNEGIFLNKWGGFYRILYVVTNPAIDRFINHYNTALGLARDWNWVHLWVLGKKDIFNSINNYKKKYNIPEHQNLRNFFSVTRVAGFLHKKMFLMKLIFSLIGRKFKKKGHKQFDFIIVDNPKTALFITKFKNLLSIPILCEVDSKEIFNRQFSNNVGGLFTADKEIFDILNSHDFASKIALAPYGKDTLTAENLGNNFERSWINRGKCITGLFQKIEEKP